MDMDNKLPPTPKGEFKLLSAVIFDVDSIFFIL